MQRITDQPRGRRSSLRLVRDPGFLAFAGAGLLMCSAALPGLSRLIVLPALLLAPGYALLRLLGQATGPRTISMAVPVSLVLTICASLLLYVSGIRLGPLSLGLLLGAITALVLAGSYGRELAAQRQQHQQAPQGDQDHRPHRRSTGDLLDHRPGRPPLAGSDAPASERR